MTKPSLMILAAGMGSRYGGLKQLDSLGPCGETIIDYSLYDALQAGFEKFVFVIRKSFEDEFIKKISSKLNGKAEVHLVFQEFNSPIDGLSALPEREKPWGTGHAMAVCANVINEPFAVINADDFYGRDSFFKIYDFLSNLVNESHYGMVGYILNNTLSENGYVSRGVCESNDQGFLTSIVERTKISKIKDRIYYEDQNEQYYLSNDSIVSMNFWGFHQNIFEQIKKELPAFVSENLSNPKAEYFIPLIVNNFINTANQSLKVLTSSDQWYGVTYKEDKETVTQKFAEFSTKGKYPSPLWG